MTLQFLGYALPGAVVFAFGVGWSWGHAAPPCRTLPLLARHPVQGTLKLLVSLVGLVGSLFAAYPDGSFQYVGDVPFATVYLFFALSAVLDVLACYCPRAVTRGHARLGLALAFLMEAFLFHSVEAAVLASSAAGRQALQLLVVVMVTCAAAAAATALPGLEALEAVRCVACVVHGSWLYHCGVLLYWPRPAATAAAAAAGPALWVVLAFAWHCAAALSMLIVFLVTRRSLCSASSPRRPRHCPPPPLMSVPVLPPGPAGLASRYHSCLLCHAATTTTASYRCTSSLA